MKKISLELDIFIRESLEYVKSRSDKKNLSNKVRITVPIIVEQLIEREDGIILNYILSNTKYTTSLGVFFQLEKFLESYPMDSCFEDITVDEFIYLISATNNFSKEQILDFYHKKYEELKQLDSYFKENYTFDDYMKYEYGNKKNNFTFYLSDNKKVDNKTICLCSPELFLILNMSFNSINKDAEQDTVSIRDLEKQIINKKTKFLDSLLEWFGLNSKKLISQLVWEDNFYNKANKKIYDDISKLDVCNNNFSKKNKVKDDNLKNSFENFEEIDYSEIPDSMKEYCSCINEKFEKGKPCEILGRDNELEDLWDILSKREKRNAILVGEAGVGKTAIIEKLTWEIVNQICPEQFKNFKVILLNINALIAGTNLRGMAEERFDEVVKYLEENQNIILFIDEIHTIIGAGNSGLKKSSLDFSNSLKPVLAGKYSRVIGATTVEEYESWFSKDQALKRRFEKIDVKEPKPNEVFKMIKNKIIELEKCHNVTISEKMIQKCIFSAKCFTLINKDPDRTLDLIDRAMTKAKRLCKPEVDDDCISKVYARNFEKLANRGDFLKTRTAYHEIGHYLLNSNNVVAVTIVPTDEFEGANINDVENPINDKAYFENLISVLLGGRIAEKMYTDNYSAGSASDLEKATKIAYSLITKFGMGNNIGKNRVYLNKNNYNEDEFKMYNEQLITSINKEIDIIIEKAYNKAEYILNEKRELLDYLVKQLLADKILSKAELKEAERNFLLKQEPMLN